jgi:hypothetical protein
MKAKKKTTIKTETNLLKELNLLKNFAHRLDSSPLPRPAGPATEKKTMDRRDEVATVRVSGSRGRLFLLRKFVFLFFPFLRFWLARTREHGIPVSQPTIMARKEIQPHQSKVEGSLCASM